MFAELNADAPPPSPSFLKSSQYCDSDSELIARAVKNITLGARTDREKVIKVFYWVRDNIIYELGLKADKASETLVHGRGSCTNKSNLAVAMLRHLGIPAGFHLMEVRAKDYLGSLCTERFNRFMGEKSLHTYCSAMIEGKWVKVDPADDIRLSNAIQHLCVQAKAIHFDGHNDARLCLDPEHVFSDSLHPLECIDFVLSKTRKVPSAALQVMNRYLDYLRQHCIWSDSVHTVEAEFFNWLRRHQTELWDAYVRLTEPTTAHASAVVSAPLSGTVSSSLNSTVSAPLNSTVSASPNEAHHSQFIPSGAGQA